MEEYQYCLVRIPGLSYNKVKKLECINSSLWADALYKLKKEQITLKDELCSSLFELINLTRDQEIRRKLINLKRDIFNNRLTASQDYSSLRCGQTETFYYSLVAYLRFIEEVELSVYKGRAIYIEEMLTSRSNFRALIQLNDFRNGLVLASQDLLKSTNVYINTEPSMDLSKREYRTEQSLLKYFSRAVTKTSPFSTFTTVSCVEISENIGDTIFVKDGNDTASSAIQSKIRLNNRFLMLIRNILFKYTPFSNQLIVNVNPTLELTDGNYIFLINSSNSECFQRVKISTIINVIISLVRDSSITYKDLLSQIEHLIEADCLEVKTYLDELIDLGLLELTFPISGTDPFWDRKLSEYMAGMSETDNVIREFSISLSLLREGMLAYETANNSNRMKILPVVYEKFIDALSALHIAANLPEIEREYLRYYLNKDRPINNSEKDIVNNVSNDNVPFYCSFQTFIVIKPESLFYEDTTREIGLSINKGVLAPVISTLNIISERLSYWAYSYSQKEKLKYYFLQKYQGDGKISVLTFYEDYYKDGVNKSDGSGLDQTFLN